MVCLGSPPATFGMLATALGRFEDAERHFDDSDAMNTRLGPSAPRPHEGRPRQDALHSARQGRPPAGPAAARGSRRRLRRAGVDYHAGKARKLLEAPPLSESAPPSYPAGLSERQVRCCGWSPGEDTGKSPPNSCSANGRVQRHVADVYANIGARNRAEARHSRSIDCRAASLAPHRA